MPYTSKQEKELRANEVALAIRSILVHFGCPAGTIRDALVGAIETETLCHCSASGGK